MLHLGAWYEQQACDGLTPLAAVGDPSLRIHGDNIGVPGLDKLFAAFASNPTIVQAQLRSASLREFSQQAIHPLSDFNLARSYDLNPIHDLFDSPIQLVKSEDLTCYLANGNINTGSYAYALFGDKIDPVPAGPMRTVRATSTTTLVQGVWVNGAIAFEDPLPAGRYAIVGMNFISAHIVMGRLVFSDYSHRPGCMGQLLERVGHIPRYRNGNAGLIGEFEHDRSPTVDFMADQADAAEVVYLDLIQIRKGPAN